MRLSLALMFAGYLSAQMRVEYPHSLVPGGISTGAELEAARGQDRYHGIGFASPMILSEDRLAYVSFRDGNEIVWTSQPIPLHKGELVMVDKWGQMVRGRCGNEISFVPRTPFMPPPENHDTPQITWSPPPDLPPYWELTPAPDVPWPQPPQTPDTPDIPIPEGPRPLPPIPPVTTEVPYGPVPLPWVLPVVPFVPPFVRGVVTPEPSTIVLMLSVALAVFCADRSRILKK